MKTPMLLMGAVLVFWGWRTGHLVAALVLAVALEGARVMRARLNWGDREMRRVWDLTVLLCVAAAVFCYVSWEVSEALLTFLQWLPMVFFPMMAVQAHNRRPDTSPSTFIWLWRRLEFDGAQGINGSHIYLCVCLLSASAVSDWDPLFYGGLTLLAGWALWASRPRRVPSLVLAGMYLGVVGLGYYGQHQLRNLHIQLEKKTAEWVRVFQRSAFDDLTAHTSMGRIGEMKESSRIVLQIQPDPSGPPLGKLRQASYNKLYYSTWFGAQRQLIPVPPASMDSWDLIKGVKARWVARIFMRLPGGRGLLPLPGGTVRLQHLPALEVIRTQFGAVRVSGVPGPLQLNLHHGADRVPDANPVPVDLMVPAIESKAVGRAAMEMGLERGQRTEEVMGRMAAFFGDGFRYVPFQTSREWRLTSKESLMNRFLLEDRSGHCEWFATATVLLLRRAGIPARYATGFAVQPESKVGNAFLVRERDAHAWALAYLDGAWQDVDFTPGGWARVEEARASWGQPLWDWLSQGWFRFSWWREAAPLGWVVPYAIAALALAAVWILWQLFRRPSRPRRERGGEEEKDWGRAPGADSEFYEVERLLAGLGLGRAMDETMRDWLWRVRGLTSFPGGWEKLEAALDLHYRLRFDPAGVEPENRNALSRHVEDWKEETMGRVRKVE